MAEKSTRLVTKSVRFSSEESDLISQISQREHLSEGTFMRKLVLDGLERYRLDQAIARYESGERNLGQTARDAGVSIYQMIEELDRRGVYRGSGEHVIRSLENLVELFGGSPELRETIAEAKARQAQVSSSAETARRPSGEVEDD